MKGGCIRWAACYHGGSGAGTGWFIPGTGGGAYQEGYRAGTEDLQGTLTTEISVAILSHYDLAFALLPFTSDHY